MQTLTFILYLFAAICLYAAIHHLVFFIRKTQASIYLTFSIMCFLHIGYFISQGLWYSSATVDQAFLLVQISYSLVSLILISQFWFFYAFCEKTFRIFWCYLGSIVFGLFSILSFIPNDLMLSIGSATLKKTTFFNLVGISVYEFQPGYIFALFFIATFAEMFFLLAVVCEYYLKLSGTLFKPMPIALGLMVVAAIHDTLSALGVINTIYISEFAYLTLVLVMAYRLQNSFFGAKNTTQSAKGTTVSSRIESN